MNRPCVWEARASGARGSRGKAAQHCPPAGASSAGGYSNNGFSRERVAAVDGNNGHPLILSLEIGCGA